MIWLNLSGRELLVPKVNEQKLKFKVGTMNVTQLVIVALRSRDWAPMLKSNGEGKVRYSLESRGF